MKEYIYLALVKDDFTLDSDALAYFENQEIHVLKHMEKLGILKLRSKKNLKEQELNYVEHLEQDQVMEIQDDSLPDIEGESFSL